MLFSYLIIFLISFAFSFLFTPIIKSIALRYGFVAYPRDDRWHKRPTALLGGIGIYCAALITIIFIGNFDKYVLGMLIGGTFLLIVGLLDDKIHFTPYFKLFAQIVAGCIAVFSGIVIGLPISNLIVIPLTLLWIVGVTNSFNLLDNIDGLAAGIAAIASFMLFFSSLIFSNNPLSIYCLVLSGAALGFLPYNFNKAKIFMGDSGSMFLGYTLAVISISGTSRHFSNFLVTMLVPVLILSVPIFDTIFVMILRKLQGRRIFEGGKDHTSHHLVTLGLSQKNTVILLYAISVAFGLIAVLYSKLNLFVVSVIAFLSITVLLFFGFFLSELSYGKTRMQKSKIRSHYNENNGNLKFNFIFSYKRRIVEVLLDFTFICIAYYAGYFLRYEGNVLSANMTLIQESLPWIILIKMSLFFAFGLYRGVWKYISLPDLITMFKVITFASVGSILFVTFAFRFQYYSRAVFFIDWLILLFLVSGSRILFRIIGEFLSRIKEKGKNVLIFGAGDFGEMLIREIKRNRFASYNPVGFIDDDPLKIGSIIHGVSVLGSRHRIKSLVSIYDVKELIIAIRDIDEIDLAQIIGICQDCNISHRRIKNLLDDEEIPISGKS